MKRITHLRHIGLITPKVSELARFYGNTWGLGAVPGKEGVCYFRGSSGEPYIVALYNGQKNAIHHLSFGLSDKQAVDDAAEEVRSKGIQILREPGSLSGPGGGYGFRFADPDGRCIELSSEVLEGGPVNWTAPVIPNKISHVVLNSGNLEKAVEFYTKILGFRISDWSENLMVFLRCNTDHHSISFNRASYSSLNHIAYEVASMDQVMRGIGNLKKQDTPIIWGPGRHGPGNNVFCYFQDPAGFVVEYTSDIDKIEDEEAHQPQVWERKPDLIDRWGTSGPPSLEARTAMAGIPDPGRTAT